MSTDIRGPEQCFQWGTILKPHGIKGALRVLTLSDHPLSYPNPLTVYVGQGTSWQQHTLQLFTELSASQFQATLSGITTRTQAESLAGATLHLPLAQLPKLRPGQFYYHQIIGLMAEDDQHGPLGTITDVLEMPAQDLLQIHRPDGTELLVPIHDGTLGPWQPGSPAVRLSLPSGLLEVFEPGSAAEKNEPTPQP